uniref:BZIP domain-containing protein n=1 Tax=Steinernema glaseri TaxID=37863 RepID=A0A1I8A521_9BILA
MMSFQSSCVGQTVKENDFPITVDDVCFHRNCSEIHNELPVTALRTLCVSKVVESLTAPVLVMCKSCGLNMTLRRRAFSDATSCYWSAPSMSQLLDRTEQGLIIPPEIEGMSDDEARKRREQLNRRPSYRMIYKDIETVGDTQLKTEPEDEPTSPLLKPSSATPNAAPVSMSNTSYATPVAVTRPGPSIPPHLVTNGSGPSVADITVLSGLARGVAASAVRTNAVPPPDGGIPPGSIASAHTPQISPAGAVVSNSGPPQGLMIHPHEILGLKPADATAVTLATSGSFMNNHGEWQSPLQLNYNSSPSPLDGGNDDSNRKRQVRLQKNREAAKECRRKKKEYVKCLENRVAVLENQNKALIEELKTLKELYCRKEKADM